MQNYRLEMPNGSDLVKQFRAVDNMHHPIRFDDYENLTMNISQWFRDVPYLQIPLTANTSDPRVIDFHLTHDQLIQKTEDDPFNGNFNVCNLPDKLYFYVNGNKIITPDYKEILVSGVIIINGMRTPF